MTEGVHRTAAAADVATSPATERLSLPPGTGVLVADRDPAKGAAIAQQLLARGLGQVHTVETMEDFLAAGEGHTHLPVWCGAVWDAGLSGEDSALTAFLERWYIRHPNVPVVVTDDSPSTSRALAVLRGKAADLAERGDSDGTVAAVIRVLRQASDSADADPREGQRRMLVIGAHPDDVEIGIGGTIHRRAEAGWDVTVLTLSHGACGGDPDRRRREAAEAARVMGARLVIEDLPDGSIVDNSSTIQTIERTVHRVQPDVVLVHSDRDTHQDHRAVHRATLVAARRVPRVACYQSPSATVNYRPNRFVELRDRDVESKLAAIDAHRSQASSRWYLEEELLRSTARYWGRFCQSRYAEPLEVIRDATHLGYFPEDHAA